MNAFVLAGGLSTRMGRDKALLEWAGKPLIAHALDKLRALGHAPQIAGTRPDLEVFAPVVPDQYPRAGPLGGIASALAVTGSEQNIFLPVDLPGLPLSFLLWLVRRAEVTGATATVPRLRGLPQPLCAIYSRALLPHLHAALAEGDAKVMRAVERAGIIDAFDVESVASAESWDSPHRWFDNLNTPNDFQRTMLEQSSRIQ